MSLEVNALQRFHLEPLKYFEPEDVIGLCKMSFEYLTKGFANKSQENVLFYKHLVQKYQDKWPSRDSTRIEKKDIQHLVDAIIWLLVNTIRTNLSAEKFTESLEKMIGGGFEATTTIEILWQFVRSKRGFIETCLNTAQLRAYHLVDLNWRLDIRVASRALMKQCQVLVTMKLFLHTESKNRNRHPLHESTTTISSLVGQEQGDDLEENRKNRKIIVLQTDLNTLVYMIRTLEEALMESRTRRIRNFISAIN